MVSVLQGYAVAVPKLQARRVRPEGERRRAALLQSPGGGSAQRAVGGGGLWGPKVAASLVEVDAVILGGGGGGGGGGGRTLLPLRGRLRARRPCSSFSDVSSSATAAAAASPSRPGPGRKPQATSAPRVVGLVSSASASDKSGARRAAGERQFFSVNGRPVDLPKAGRVLNECWRALGSPLTSSSRPVADSRPASAPKVVRRQRHAGQAAGAAAEGERAAGRAAQGAARGAWEPSRATYQLHGPSPRGLLAASASTVAVELLPLLLSAAAAPPRRLRRRQGFAPAGEARGR